MTRAFSKICLVGSGSPPVNLFHCPVSRTAPSSVSFTTRQPFPALCAMNEFGASSFRNARALCVNVDAGTACIIPLKISERRLLAVDFPVFFFPRKNAPYFRPTFRVGISEQ